MQWKKEQWCTARQGRTCSNHPGKISPDSRRPPVGKTLENVQMVELYKNKKKSISQKVLHIFNCMIRKKWIDVYLHIRNLHSLHSRMCCAYWIWRRKGLNVVNVYFFMWLLSPLRNRTRSFILINLNPFTKGCFVPSLAGIGPLFLESVKPLEPQHHWWWRESHNRSALGVDKNSDLKGTSV